MTNSTYYILLYINIVEFNLDCQQYQHESMRKI